MCYLSSSSSTPSPTFNKFIPTANKVEEAPLPRSILKVKISSNIPRTLTNPEATLLPKKTVRINSEVLALFTKDNDKIHVLLQLEQKHSDYVINFVNLAKNTTRTKSKQTSTKLEHNTEPHKEQLSTSTLDEAPFILPSFTTETHLSYKEHSHGELLKKLEFTRIQLGIALRRYRGYVRRFQPSESKIINYFYHYMVALKKHSDQLKNEIDSTQVDNNKNADFELHAIHENIIHHIHCIQAATQTIAELYNKNPITFNNEIDALLKDKSDEQSIFENNIAMRKMNITREQIMKDLNTKNEKFDEIHVLQKEIEYLADKLKTLFETQGYL